MKSLFCGIVLTVAVLTLPWRLMALGADVLTSTPGYVRTRQDDSAYWKALDLQSKLADWGWDVSYDDILSQGILGVTDTGKHTIVIEETLHWSDRYTTLVHEGAHTLQPGWLNRQQAEVFAESVSALIDPHGMREHARYLSTLKLDFVFTAAAEWPTIYQAAALLR